ncbi:MAG: ATP-binding protein [Actinomycetota bacterium]
MKRLANRYRDLPIYAKILAPFAVLILAWGGFGTAILAHGTTSEARARATAQLSTAFDGARAMLADDEQNLLASERLAANTEGVAAAVAHHDLTLLRQLLEPLAVNAGHDGLRVVDRTGVVLLSVDTTVTPAKILREPPLTLPAVLRATRGESDARGDKFAQLSSTDLIVAGPIRDAGGRAVGAVVVSDNLAGLAGRMGRGTSARIVMFTTDGVQRAANGGPLPYREATTNGLQVRARVGGQTMEVLYGPLDVRGERAGTLGVGLVSHELLAGIQGKSLMLTLLVGIAVLVALLIGLVTARMITTPVASLVDATRALQQGELHVRAPEGAKDEVGALAASFNAMAAELEASHRNLELQVAERTTALQTANAQLVRASSAKTAFIAMLSHELRTPLNGIIGFADMLADPMFGEHSVDETRDLATNIMASGRHLLGLINDLLDMAKIEAGKIDIRPAPTEMGSVVYEVENVLGALARAKRIKMVTDIDADTPSALIDPARMRQVLFNIVSNAIKFTPEGGQITIDVVNLEQSVTVSITDTGPGLAPDEIDRIFRPYERGDAVSDEEGAGLGLALARSLVELQGGRIWVKSVPGQGCTFSVLVPSARVERIEVSQS